MVAGAGVGAAVQGPATGGTVQQYSVKLNSGGQTIISTNHITGSSLAIKHFLFLFF